MPRSFPISSPLVLRDKCERDLAESLKRDRIARIREEGGPHSDKVAAHYEAMPAEEMARFRAQWTVIMFVRWRKLGGEIRSLIDVPADAGEEDAEWLRSHLPRWVEEFAEEIRRCREAAEERAERCRSGSHGCGGSSGDAPC